MTAPEKLRALIASLRSCSCIYGCKCEEAARALEVLLQPVIYGMKDAFNTAYFAARNGTTREGLTAARAALIEEMMRDK